jgi:hypothetical protein
VLGLALHELRSFQQARPSMIYIPARPSTVTMLLLPFRFDFVFGLVCSLIDHVQTTKVGTAGTANSNQPLGSLQNREAALQVNKHQLRGVGAAGVHKSGSRLWGFAGWTETSYRKLCEMTDLL